MKEQRMARSLVGKGSLATKLVLTLVAACMAIRLGGLVGCSSGEKQQEGSGQSTEDISVYSREDGSGTRGAFIELFPNLSGLAEPRAALQEGDRVSVYLKAVLPERMKIKLLVIDRLPAEPAPPPLTYYITGGTLTRWRYAPECCAKSGMETVFGG